jgi:5S rRNA maturation endonuclease (ribonuclease M5)
MYLHLTEGEKKKKIENIIESLKNSIVIVEGKKDKESLMNLGINAITISKALSIKEKLSGKIVILTDLDKEGKNLAMLLEQKLKNEKNKIDTETRVKLLLLLETKYVENVFKSYKKIFSNF